MATRPKLITYIASPIQKSRVLALLESRASAVPMTLLFVRWGEGEILQEFFKAEEFAAQRAGVGRPFRFPRFEGKRGARGGQLRINVIQVMKNQRFANHRQLRGTKFILAVVTNEKMLDHSFQIRRETFDSVHSSGNGFNFHHNV